ncbi:hypothetical protein ScPMuIL_009695 [Solemya velum]
MYWWCSVRQKDNKCPATVIQKGTTFVLGNNTHNQPGNPGALLQTKVRVEVLRQCVEDTQKSANCLAEDVIMSIRDEDDHQFPKLANEARAVNRCRQGMRPPEPASLDFQLADCVPPDFIRSDIHINGARHIIFATDEQLRLLSDTRTWYLDATFKVTLKAVKTSISSTPDSDEVVCDFEAAIWGAVKEVFPSVTIHGCTFHWCQAVYRKISELGLQTAYKEKGPVFRLLKKLLALPYLPRRHIRPTFDELRQQAGTSEKLVELFIYTDATWFQSSVWGPARDLKARTLCLSQMCEVEKTTFDLNIRKHGSSSIMYSNFEINK